MTTEERDPEVEAMKKAFSNAMQGNEIFTCLVALTEQLAEVLLTMNDMAPEDYNVFQHFDDMLEDALDSAQYLEGLEAMDISEETAH